MINLALDPELVLRELTTWRDATLMTRRRGTPRRESEPRMLAGSMSGAAERVDGFLMLLQSCSTVAEDANELAQLIAELREFRAWVEQGQHAADLLQSLVPAASRKRTPAHPRR
jgi:hypothetical protein